MQVADETLNACVTCAFDASINGALVGDDECRPLESRVMSTAPGDACPNQFWVELDPKQGIGMMVSHGIVESNLSETACNQALLITIVYHPVTMAPLRTMVTPGAYCSETGCDPNGEDICFPCPVGSCNMEASIAIAPDELPSGAMVLVLPFSLSGTTITPTLDVTIQETGGCSIR
jgi:hypothetical protein